MKRKTPDPILRDAGRHAYERVSEVIRQMSDIHDGENDVCTVIASNAMQAAFMSMYVCARLAHPNEPISARDFALCWVDAMGPALDKIEKAFHVAVVDFPTEGPSQ